MESMYGVDKMKFGSQISIYLSMLVSREAQADS